MFFKNFVGVQLLYNVVLVSIVQQNESAICIIYIPSFGISFLYRSPQSIEQSSLSYTVGSYQLSVLCIVSIVYIQCIYVNPNLPIHPTPPPLSLFGMVELLKPKGSEEENEDTHLSSRICLIFQACRYMYLRFLTSTTFVWL